jgi:hypothetical protein
MLFNFFKKPKLHPADQKELLQILEAIKSIITLETDLVWAYYESIEKLIQELDELIEEIKVGKLETLKRLAMHFAPTSGFQELSIENGWSEEYLKLADRFDRIYEKYN